MQIREPKVAGMFYPSNPNELKAQLHELFSNVKLSESFNEVAGLVSPHAGYIYSGKIAASAFKTVENKKFKKIIVISPSHREYFPGISIYSGDAYGTPLGNIEVNKELREEIVSKDSLLFSGIEGHRYEHALEVQLPFLQIVQEDFSLIPMVIGDQRKEFMFRLADILTDVIDEDTLLVSSSDLSHFYTKSQAKILDSRVADDINEFKYEQLQSDLDNKRCEACGGGGIVALLKSLKNKNYRKAKVIAQADSGDITGDNSEVVGYLAAVVYN